MAKAMTKSQVYRELAGKAGITKKAAGQFPGRAGLPGLKGSQEHFTLPGLGKLVLVNRKARMGRNPQTGEPIKIPAKRVVKFRVAKACKTLSWGRNNDSSTTEFCQEGPPHCIGRPSFFQGGNAYSNVLTFSGGRPRMAGLPAR